MGKPRKLMNVLNDEELFWQYYKEYGPGGSIPKLNSQLRDKGIYVTTSAVWQSINRYLARNYDNPKVKQAVKDYYIAFGYNLTDDEYHHMISKHARTCFAKKQYKNWVLENPTLPDLREDK